MAFEFTKEWCETAGAREDGLEIGAGLIADDPMFLLEANGSDCRSASRLALGRFINLMRRKQGLSIEDLAEKANIEVADLLNLENNASQIPDALALCQLAEAFGVSQQKLMALSGLMPDNDGGYVEEAVRYAAKSESVEVLSNNEQVILDGFMSVLSENAQGR